MRFRSEQHLRRQSDFRAVRELGRRINCGAFTLWCSRREDPAAPSSDFVAATVSVRPAPHLVRVGVVASTASVGNAVLRNRAKRRLREIFRRHQEVVPPGCDLLLTARTAATLWPMPELEKKFLDACRQIAPTSRP